jgi:GAF domain-containing protein
VDDEAAQWASDRDRFVRAQRSAAGADSVTGLDDAGPLAREFAALTRTLLAASTVAQVLGQVVAAAQTVIPAAQLASVTLRSTDGAFHTPVQTDPIAAALDQQQHQSGRGPCVDAARPDGPAMAMAGDLATDARWPEFAAASVRAGYRSVLVTTLMASPGRAGLGGALNLYARGPGAFVPADQDQALLLATHAALAVATTQAVSAADLERSQLNAAIASRDVIGQAKGILMARQGLGAEEAFDVLRRTSQDLNVKLVELARTVAEHPAALDTNS